jgi:amino-acid N-acetyltransferase
VKAEEVTIERARLADVEEMKAVLDLFAESGELLGRSRLDFYENIRDFIVARSGGRVVGLAALHILWFDLGEIRSLAVRRELHGTGIGRLLVDQCLADARALGLSKVFALTYRPGFFGKMGFREVEKSELPHKVWKICLDCVKFPDCDEIAVMREV